MPSGVADTHAAAWYLLDTTEAVSTRAAAHDRSPPEEPKPPPAVDEVVRVPVDEEGREMEAP